MSEQSQEENLEQTISPTSLEQETISHLPVAIFEGEIILIDSDELVEHAVETLRNEPVLGFDTETKPSFKKGVTHLVSLLQLSTATRCFLFRLNLLTHIEPIAELLADPSIKKVGISIHDDLRGLSKRGVTNPRNFIEMQTYSTALGIEHNSLQKLFAFLFHKKISKKQRLSNWEAEELEPPKLIYAATDAWASLLIYEGLQKIALEQGLNSQDLEVDQGPKATAAAKESEKKSRYRSKRPKKKPTPPSTEEK